MLDCSFKWNKHTKNACVALLQFQFFSRKLSIVFSMSFMSYNPILWLPACTYHTHSGTHSHSHTQVTFMSSTPGTPALVRPLWSVLCTCILLLMCVPCYTSLTITCQLSVTWNRPGIPGDGHTLRCPYSVTQLLLNQRKQQNSCDWFARFTAVKEATEVDESKLICRAMFYCSKEEDSVWWHGETRYW